MTYKLSHFHLSFWIWWIWIAMKFKDQNEFESVIAIQGGFLWDITDAILKSEKLTEICALSLEMLTQCCLIYQLNFTETWGLP